MKSDPAKITYVQGQSLDLDVTGAVITATYNDETAEDVIVTFGMVSGYNENTLGQQTITVTYNGQTTTFNVTVIAKSVTGIAMKTSPTKTNYVVGQSLNVTGAVITATYNDSSTADVTVTSDMVSGYDPNALGTQTITINYGGQTTTFVVAVIEKALTGITIKSTPTKTTYIVGQSLDVAGAVITATYNDETSEDVIVTSGMVSGYSSNTVGNQTITVLYSGKTATFTVTVFAVAVTGVSIKSNPAKTTYLQGESLDLTGGVITVSYNDGSIQDMDIIQSMISGYNANTSGQQIVSVTYSGKIATFNVTVILLRILSGNPSITVNRSNGTIYGFGVGTSVSSLISMLSINGGTLHVYSSGGQEISSDNVGTGVTVKLLYASNNVADQLTTVLHGDTNGDGSISITDLLQVEAVILKKSSLNDVYAIAADTNRDGSVSITDLLQIESDILGKAKVAQ
jgi:hypothetical protein